MSNVGWFECADIRGVPDIWTPSRIPTALWLDAADPSTITLNGSTVSQWNDKSGNVRHASQATSTKQPTNGAGINGLNALSFDGGDVLITAELFDAANSVAMMFAVVNHTETGTHTLMSTKTVAANGWSWQFSSTTSILYFNAGYSPNVSGTPQSGNSILGVIKNGLSVRHSIDGVLGTESVISGYAASTYNLTAIGAEDSGTASYYIGLIGEIVCTDFISDVVRQRIEGYLAHKWRLS